MIQVCKYRALSLAGPLKSSVSERNQNRSDKFCIRIEPEPVWKILYPNGTGAGQINSVFEQNRSRSDKFCIRTEPEAVR